MPRKLLTAIVTLLLAALSHRLGHAVLAILLGGVGTTLMVMALTGFDVPHAVLMIFGLTLGLCTPVSIWQSVNLLQHSSAATGTVVRLEHANTGRWGRTVPHVRFRTEGGRLVEFEVPENLYEPGDRETVVVRYEPADPEHSARLGGFRAMFGMDVTNGLLGIGLAGVAICSARRHRAQGQRSGPR